MRWVIAPDSFKGSLSAAKVAAALARGIARVDPRAELLLRPMADGGEGTLEALCAAGLGQWRHARVAGVDGTFRPVRWLCLEDGAAVVEVAEVVGLPDAGDTRPGQRSTVGVGALIRAVLDTGCRRILIGLGGSSTNDGGAGCLVALGARLLDSLGQEVAPVPEALVHLHRVELSGLDARLARVQWTVLSDVGHPLTGPEGATRVFGPQKGVASHELEAFDAALAHWARQAEQAFGQRCAHLPGSGAAGGLGFALRLLGGQVESGAAVVARLTGVEAAIAGADWVLTGEGRSDGQTLHGKAPARVATLAREAGVPVSLLSGGLDRQALSALLDQFDGCFSIQPGPATLEEAVGHTEDNLSQTAAALAQVILANRSLRKP